MEYLETLIKEIQLSDVYIVRWYSLDPPQPQFQRNMTEMFGLQTQTIRIEKNDF